MSLRAGLLFLDALERLPAQAAAAPRGRRSRSPRSRSKYAQCRDFLFVGRLYEYPTALEGALKLKEISYIHAEGVQAAEMKHGPIALIEPGVPTVVLAAQAEIRDKMLGNTHEILARVGQGHRRGAGGGRGAGEARARHDLHPEDPGPARARSSPSSRCSCCAYYVAVERGCDVDKPRNLAKSVTVE